MRRGSSRHAWLSSAPSAHATLGEALAWRSAVACASSPYSRGARRSCSPVASRSAVDEEERRRSAAAAGSGDAGGGDVEGGAARREVARRWPCCGLSAPWPDGEEREAARMAREGEGAGRSIAVGRQEWWAGESHHSLL